MRSDELLTALRYSAYIGDGSAFPAYTDARLLLELNDKLNTVFGDIITKTRAGYWLKDIVVTTTPGRQRYRIPPRAVAGGLEKVEISNSILGPFARMTEVPAATSSDWEPQVGTLRFPILYTIQGDQIELLPGPDAAYFLRLTYYIRPSRLVAQQSSTLGGGTVRGQIAPGGINTVARTLTVNVLPFDQELAVPAAITSALQTIDVVHPNGWHELALVGATQTIAGLIFTVGGTADMSDIEVGDFVRVSEQTDWPCLPDDYHRCLADIAAVKVAVELSMDDKAASVAENVQSDMLRFRSILTPRVKAAPPEIPVCLAGGRSGWYR